MIRALYNNDVTLATLQDNTGTATAITNKDAAGWMLTYFGVTLAIGLISGLLVSLILKALGDDNVIWFDDRQWFHKNFGYLGLHPRDINKARKEEQQAQSAENLNREQDLHDER